MNTAKLFSIVKERELYPALVNQLQKDFTLANIPVSLHVDLTPSELESLLVEKIYRLIMDKFPEYLNLLYSVDVPENAFEGISGSDVVEVSRQVALLILERELQKVELKRKYGS